MQGRAFLEAKHAFSLAQLTQALEVEHWSAVPVPPISQAVVTGILSRAGLKPCQSDSHPHRGQLNGEQIRNAHRDESSKHSIYLFQENESDVCKITRNASDEASVHGTSC